MNPRTQLLSVALLSLLSACTAPYVKAYAGYTEMAVSGDVALAPTVGGVNLDTIKVDTETDLGLDEASGSPYARVDLGFGPVSLTASGFQYSETGTGTLSQSFGNIVVGTQVATELEFTNVKAAAMFNLIDIGPFHFAPGLGVDYFDMNMSVRSISGPAAYDQLDVQAPLPLLYAQSSVDIGPLGVTLDVGGITGDFGDADGTVLDAELLARIKPTKHFELFAGYRWISIDVEGRADGQSFSAELEFKGWMFGGGINF